jgi:raffinose/stachyose/melibiose transport system permease protein
MFPFYIVLISAGKNTQEIMNGPLSPPKGISTFISNIGTIINHPNVRYPSSFLTSLIITVFSVALIILTSSMAAWVLVREKTKVSSGIFMMFVAAMVIPFQVIMFPLVQWFRIVGSFLHIPILYTHGGMIFAYIGFGASLSVFLYHGFIKSIPYELEEAANIDGCGKTSTFFRIVLPLLSPISVTVMILNGMWIWNDYLLPLMILSIGKPVQTLPLAVMNFAGSYVKQWDLILTAALMAIIPIIAVYLFLQRYIIKGMTEGAIK